VPLRSLKQILGRWFWPHVLFFTPEVLDITNTFLVFSGIRLEEFGDDRLVKILS
jgi:hypothetical protein